MKVKLIISTEFTKISPTDVRLNRLLFDMLRYLSPKATSYNPAFMSGKWDGFVTLYDYYKSQFPTGLLPRVINILKEQNIEYELVYNRNHVDYTNDIVYTPIHRLRQYQQDAVDAALKWRRGIIHIPTGGGKTEVIQAVISESKVSRVVFVCPSVAVLTQTKRRMKDVFSNIAVMEWGGGSNIVAEKVDLDKYIVVCTVQSSFRQKSHLLLQNAEMIIVDECHHQSASTFKEVTRACSKASYIYGLSATPYRHDGCDLELEAWIGKIIYSIDYESLISGGYLVPPEFYKVKNLEEGLEMLSGLKTMIFSEKIEDLDKAKPYWDKYNVTVLTSKDSVKRRKEVLDAFTTGEINTIAATPLFDEGLDIPSMDAVFFYATCGSKVRAIQRIGRAMRPSPGKSRCVVVDLFDDKYTERYSAYLREPAFASRLK